MQISPWLIYLWGQVDTWLSVFGFLAGICSIIGLAGSIVTRLFADSDFPNRNEAGCIRKIFLGILIFGIFSIGVRLLVPNSKTIATMVVLPAIVNSQPIQKDLPEIYDIAIKALKEKLGAEEEKK